MKIFHKKLLEAPVEERVDAGVRWLDENIPDWLDRVVVNKLDLSNGCKCVLGQLFAKAYDEGARKVSITSRFQWPFNVSPFYAVIRNNVVKVPGVPKLLSHEQAKALGFDVVGLGGDYSELTDEWKARISRLRRERAAARA